MSNNRTARSPESRWLATLVPDTLSLASRTLREAIKAVPEVKWALGVAGIAAAVAIVLGFIDLRVALIGVPVTIVLMFLLLVFARASSARSSQFRHAATVLVWFTVLVFIIFISAMLSSALSGWPIKRLYLDEASADPTYEEKIARVERYIDNRDLTGALRELQEVIAIAPDRPLPLRMAAQVHRMRGEYVRANDALERAFALPGADQVDIRADMALVASEAKDYVRSRQYADDAIRLGGEQLASNAEKMSWIRSVDAQSAFALWNDQGAHANDPLVPEIETSFERVEQIGVIPDAGWAKFARACLKARVASDPATPASKAVALRADAIGLVTSAREAFAGLKGPEKEDNIKLIGELLVAGDGALQAELGIDDCLPLIELWEESPSSVKTTVAD